MPLFALADKLRKIFSLGLNHLFPAPCLLCGILSNAADTPSLCHHCHHAFTRLNQFDFLCNCCALPLSSSAPLCGQCLANPPAFTEVKVPYLYSHPLSALIHQFKYRGNLNSGRLLSDLLRQFLETKSDPVDMLVPVPMHWSRRWQRGFNQTEVIAYHLGATLKLPVVNACKQAVYTSSQKGLKRTERLKNLRDAFILKSGAQTYIKNAHIVLIDDVITTTATVRSLSELLVKHGAKRVDVWALARTPER